KRLRRAGLDYDEFASVRTYPHFAAFLAEHQPQRVFAFTTKAQRGFHAVSFEPGDCFLFGPESRGLPEGIRNSLPEAHRLRIPMRPHSRSLNLSNTVALVVYEAWRQQGFAGGQ